MVAHLLRDETYQIMKHLMALVVLLISCYHRSEASSSLRWWNICLFGGNHFIRLNGRFPRILSRVQVHWKQAMSCKTNKDNTALRLVCGSYIKGSILRDFIVVTPNNLHVFIYFILELTIHEQESLLRYHTSSNFTSWKFMWPTLFIIMHTIPKSILFQRPS
jgi:hypothetical protein